MHGISAPPRLALAFAWTGFAGFMVSLNGGFVAFLVGMHEAPRSQAGTLPAITNAALFTIFVAHHSLLARTDAKAWILRRLGSDLERTVYVWIASLLYLAVWVLWQPLPGVLYRQHGLWAVAHWIVVAAGFGVTLAAARLIDPLDLAGVRQAAGTSDRGDLEVSGPYHLVRHPIYLGWLLIVFGVPEMTWTRFEFAVLSSAYLFLAVPYEERSLVDAFGERYRAYQAKVRWRIVPGLW